MSYKEKTWRWAILALPGQMGLKLKFSIDQFRAAIFEGNYINLHKN